QSLLKPMSCGRSRSAENLVAVQREIKIAAEIRQRDDVQLNCAARRKNDGRGEFTERPVAIRRAEAGRVEQRLALKEPSGTLVGQGIKKLNALWREFRGLK